MRRWARSAPLVAAVALALALLLGACGRPDAGPPPNVLIVTLDTVRADRLGCYGAARRDITPHLDARAKQGVLFENAFANSSFTPPTHASIFTGLYPAEHALQWWNRHLADVPTAAEAFRNAGYRTLAFTPMATLFKLGLDRGFDQALDVPYAMRDGVPILADADAINAEAVPALSAADKRPFFAWIHYYDAHRPYARQGPEWSGRFTNDDDPSVGADESWYQLTPAMRSRRGLTPGQSRLIKDHYDGGLAYLDDRVGDMLDALEGAGVLENTIVVLIADHGEVLDEHDEQWFAHDPYLVDETLHVPLLLLLPGGRAAGRRVPDLVSQVDLLPTLLALARVHALPGALSGRDLSPLLDGGRLPAQPVYADRMGDDRNGQPPDRRFSVRTADRQLVMHADSQTMELRAVDGSAPAAADLSGREPATRRELNGLLGRWLGSLHQRGTEGSDETDELLRALGYIGAGTSPAAPPAGTEPPPDAQPEPEPNG